MSFGIFCVHPVNYEKTIHAVKSVIYSELCHTICVNLENNSTPGHSIQCIYQVYKISTCF